jgi:hypothetical protein
MNNKTDEENKHFTVKDRRRLHMDPESADSTPEEAAPEPEPVETGSAAAPEPLPQVEFGAFIASLAAQAASFLAEEEHAAEAEGAAREIIAILEMLQDKTEGRRTEQETRILESVLFELRMVFVHRGQANA